MDKPNMYALLQLSEQSKTTANLTADANGVSAGCALYKKNLPWPRGEPCSRRLGWQWYKSSCFVGMSLKEGHPVFLELNRNQKDTSYFGGESLKKNNPYLALGQK